MVCLAIYDNCITFRLIYVRQFRRISQRKTLPQTSDICQSRGKPAPASATTAEQCFVDSSQKVNVTHMMMFIVRRPSIKRWSAFPHVVHMTFWTLRA